MKKKETIFRISDFLDDVLKDAGILIKVKEQMAIYLWREIVGEEIYKNAKPEKVENGILYIRCRSSSWKQEINFKREEIIREINRRLKMEIIKGIKFLI